MLGVVDPRLLYQEMDSELLALWLAHFELKNTAIQNQINPESQPEEPVVFESDVPEEQFSAIERLM